MKKNIFLILILLIAGCASQKVIDLRSGAQKQQSESAYLAIPIEFDIVHLDKQKIDIITHYEKIITYNITPGQHLVGLRYNNMVTNDEGDKETIKSNIVQFKFNALKGKTYRVHYKKPASFTEAVELSKSLELSLYLDKNLIATSEPNDLWQLSSAIDKSTNSGLAIDSDDNETLTIPATDDTPEKHLFYWWNQADELQKQQFLQMIQ